MRALGARGRTFDPCRPDQCNLNLMADILLLISQEIFYRPIYNLVVFVYNFTPGPNLGWAIVALAIIIRLLFLYFSLRGYETDKIYNNLLPVAEKIDLDNSLSSQEKRRQLVDLLKRNNINPYSEIIAVLGQFLFLLALYFVLQVGIKPEGIKDLYPFVIHPTSIDTIFLGFDLSKPDFSLSFLASIVLFVELLWENMTKPKLAKLKFSERWYPFLLSSLTFMLLYVLPSAKAVFIFVSALFSLALKAVITLAEERS